MASNLVIYSLSKELLFSLTKAISYINQGRFLFKKNTPSIEEVIFLIQSYLVYIKICLIQLLEENLKTYNFYSCEMLKKN